MLYTKFVCLQNFLNGFKEAYCGGKPDCVSEIDYIKVGNMLKRLTKIEDEIDKSFDCLNKKLLNDLDIDEKLMEQIFNNLEKKYFEKYEKTIYDKLFEDLNIITTQVASLRGLTTTSYNYDAETQEEYVIV